MKDKKTWSLKRICTVSMIMSCILIILFYFIAGDQLRYSAAEHISDTSAVVAPIGEITAQTKIVQTFVGRMDEIHSIELLTSTGSTVHPGKIVLELFDAKGKSMGRCEAALASLMNDAYTNFKFDKPIQQTSGQTLFLLITVPQGVKGNTISVWSDKNDQIQGGERLIIDNKVQEGKICFNYYGRNEIAFGNYYWFFALIMWLVLFAYCINLLYREKREMKSIGLGLINAFSKYKFLLSQLVGRDFKTKYKRSFLGVIWSFLNPLLTMAVQYVVFSTIFKSNIPNFPTYLLTGIVFFNFFSEATNMGLGAIVGNASLITKVYIPKYIFPVSRVFSSSINLLISLAPLFVVMLITGSPITIKLILLPFPLICTIVFCIGMCFMLSSAMVYFRDMQFLWNVISILWVYATPIFYPESILPERFMFVFKLNPMYHFIRFARSIILDGVSPEPKAYLFCIIMALVPLIAGSLIFKKAQNKFVLNI